MNTKNLHQIFANYIDRFEELNNLDHNESFKWWAAAQFHAVMAAALQKSAAEFANDLEILVRKDVVGVIIDGRMQPFGGLVKIAQKNNGESADGVKQLFQNLFQDDGGDLEKREEKIAVFLDESEKLRLKYFPNYYSYKQTARSVAGYLFLYDPEHCYMYKATEARRFADDVEYYGDWGSGDQIKLKEYYRMCNELVAEIQECSALLETDKSRYTLKKRFEDEKHYGIIPPSKKSMVEDSSCHILAYDIIYCNKTYDLDRTLSFKKRSPKEKKLYQERLNKALELQEEYSKAEERYAQLDRAIEHYSTVLTPGTAVTNFRYGHGKIIARRGDALDIQFDTQPGLIGYDFWQTVTGHYLKFEDSLDKETAQQYEDIFRRHDCISSELVRLQKELEAYQDVLE